MINPNLISADDHEVSEGDNILQNNSSNQLWVPEKMISGHKSYGMVVLDTTSNSNQLIILGTSNPDVATVQKSVIIPPNSNHGIFEINTKSKGSITINAIHNGQHYTANTIVYSDTKKPSTLEIVIPGENVKADTIYAAVYSLDENGSPIAVDRNTRIKLSSSETLKTPDRVVIPFESDHVFFPIKVNGNGFISASSQGFESSRVDIQKTLEDVNVNFDIAPKIAHENSIVYFYVQLEKDGKPFKPPYVVDAFLTSSDESVISFSKESVTNNEKKNKLFSLSLVDGFAKGMAYTKNQGTAKLLVNVPTFGFGSSEIVVGKAVFNAEELGQTVQRVIENQNNTSAVVSRFEKITEEQPTDLLMWIFPKVTDKNSFAVVGAYRVVIEKEITLEPQEDETQQTVLLDQFTITPTLFDEQIVTVSSSGNVKHENTYELRQNNKVPGSALEIPLMAQGDGIHSIFVSATNLDSSTSEFEVVQQYDEQYNFHITKLPFSSGTNKDVAMISIVDGNQNIVDVSTISEDNLKLFISSQSLFVDSGDENIHEMIKNTFIVTADEINEKGLLSVASENIPPSTIEIVPSGIVSSSEIHVSPIIHVGEEFPYVVYDVDSNGIPLGINTEFDFSSGNEIDFVDENLLSSSLASDVATIAVITDNGLSSASVEIFENELSFTSHLDSKSARVNNDVFLRVISDVIGVDFTIESPFPFRQLDDDEFVITPDKELVGDITIIGAKDGYSAFSETISLDAKKIVTVKVTGNATDGRHLSIPYTIVSDSISESFSAPFVHDLKTRDSVIEFPYVHKTPVGHGYAFENMKVNNQILFSPILETELDKDLDITLNYQREVFIDVKGTGGGGVYEYGQTVNLSAPDVPKVWYFVKDTFDHWEGIDRIDSSISFNATQDMQITAVYREDHSLWMIVVLVSAVSMIVFGLYKKNESVRWMIEEYKEKLLKVVSSSLSTKSKKKAAKK